LAVPLLAAMVVQVFALVFSQRSDHAAAVEGGAFMLACQVEASTVVSWAYAGVVTPLAGKHLALVMSKLPTIGPPLSVVIGLTIVVTWLLTVSPPHQRIRLAIGLYLAVGTLASALFTRNLLWLSWNLNSNAAATPARYVFLAGALLVYMVCLLIQRLPLRDPRLQAVCLVLLFGWGIRHNFYQQPYPDFAWKTAAPKLVAWQAARAEGKPQKLDIPIMPAPWFISLP
jgi:hypothetical protein